MNRNRQLSVDIETARNPRDQPISATSRYPKISASQRSKTDKTFNVGGNLMGVHKTSGDPSGPSFITLGCLGCANYMAFAPCDYLLHIPTGANGSIMSEYVSRRSAVPLTSSTSVERLEVYPPALTHRANCPTILNESVINHPWGVGNNLNMPVQSFFSTYGQSITTTACAFNQIKEPDFNLMACICTSNPVSGRSFDAFKNRAGMIDMNRLVCNAFLLGTLGTRPGDHWSAVQCHLLGCQLYKCGRLFDDLNSIDGKATIGFGKTKFEIAAVNPLTGEEVSTPEDIAALGAATRDELLVAWGILFNRLGVVSICASFVSLCFSSINTTLFFRLYTRKLKEYSNLSSLKTKRLPISWRVHSFVCQLLVTCLWVLTSVPILKSVFIIVKLHVTLPVILTHLKMSLTQ